MQLYLCLYALFCVSSGFAQETEFGTGMLFPEFENGTVMLKNGARTQVKLNYNMIQQKMWFIDKDNQIVELANASDVLAVHIGKRQFLPVSSGGVFYELINTGAGSYFIQHKAKRVSLGKEGGYGTYSTTSANTSYGMIRDGTPGGVVNLESSEKFAMKKEMFYYLKSGNSYKRFYSAKTLGKILKGLSAQIETFAKEQSIDFSKTEDITKIVEYSFNLMN